MPIEPNPFDRPDLLDISATEKDPYVLYAIVRSSLKMGPGKVAAQVGHGVMMLMGRYVSLISQKATGVELAANDAVKVGCTAAWLYTSYRKVVLGASDKEWTKLKAELDVFVVLDAGLTDVAHGSETVLVLWPMQKSVVPKLVKRLQTLK